MKQVELGAPARLIEQPIGMAGLLGARHLVDAVVEQSDVDRLPRFQQLLQGDELLRAVVPELTIVGYRNPMSALSEPPGQYCRDGLVVPRPHPHHCRAAKTQDSDRLAAHRIRPWRPPQPTLIESQVSATVRALPPFDIRLPIDADRAAELAEILCRP